MASSRPGVSRSTRMAWPVSVSNWALSTWRVVPGRSATSPKDSSRSSVRNSEVLPVLVWPTTARSMGFGASVMGDTSDVFEPAVQAGTPGNGLVRQGVLPGLQAFGRAAQAQGAQIGAGTAQFVQPDGGAAVGRQARVADEKQVRRRRAQERADAGAVFPAVAAAEIHHVV